MMNKGVPSAAASAGAGGGAGGGVGYGGAGSGLASGPTAAAVIAAAQRQRSLLQRADADIISLLDNFSHLLKAARVCTIHLLLICVFLCVSLHFCLC